MEVLVVDFGCSYERYVVGVARDLAEARSMARSYAVMYGSPVLEFQYFAVQRQVLGVSCDGFLDWDRLDLDVAD